MRSPSEEGTQDFDSRVGTKGSLVALLYVMAVALCFGAVGRAFPNLAQSTSDGIYVVYLMVALAGAIGIVRYLPDSKERVLGELLEE